MPKQKNNKKKNEPGWSEVTLRFHPISKSQTLAQLSLRGVAKTHAFVVLHFPLFDHLIHDSLLQSLSSLELYSTLSKDPKN